MLCILFEGMFYHWHLHAVKYYDLRTIWLVGYAFSFLLPLLKSAYKFNNSYHARVVSFIKSMLLFFLEIKCRRNLFPKASFIQVLLFLLLICSLNWFCRLFLLGLEKYGKGDWRSISRNFVISRTPTQVASHAQKYFIRLNSMNRERRRSSIHDITSVNNGDASAAQGPITGQTNGQAANPGKPSKQSPQPANTPPGVDAYGTTIGQPVGGPLVSAVGTPVTLPVPAPPHMAYGMHAPVPGAVVPGAPVNIAPMPYPMPPPSSHGWETFQSAAWLLNKSIISLSCF